MLIMATMLTAPVMIVSASLGVSFTPARAATVMMPLQVLSWDSLALRCCFLVSSEEGFMLSMMVLFCWFWLWLFLRCSRLGVSWLLLGRW